jgi:hypothetical protein
VTSYTPLAVASIRDWLGPSPLINSIVIRRAGAYLRRRVWRSKTAEAYAATSGSATRSVPIGLNGGGGSAVIALRCSASADIIATLPGLRLCISQMTWSAVFDNCGDTMAD